VSRVPYAAWKRVLACTLAYVVVLQGFLYLVAGCGVGLQAADGTPFAASLLCVHGGGAATPPGPSDQGPATDSHCPFCTACSVYVNCAPPPSPQYVMAVFAGAMTPASASSMLALAVIGSAWPRGPPAAA
jgi:hypothetical protein